MDFIKTKCKQRNVNHIAKYDTRQWGTGQNGVKNRNEGLTIAKVSYKDRWALKVTKTFINAKRVDSTKFGNEAHFMSFAAIIATRNGTEGSNFHIRNTMTAIDDPETSSIFSNNPLVSFRHSKNIRETLVHSNLPQELSSPCGTFPCGVGQCKTCKFIDSSTTISAPKFVYHIKHHFTCTSSHLIYCISCSRCGMLYIGETGRCLRTRFGEHRRSVTSNDANLLPDTSTMAVIVFLIWKFEPSVPFLVAMIAAKDMKCASFPNLVLSTLLALMNVLVTFNAHLSLSDTFAIVSPSFLFFTPFCPVPHCLVSNFAIWFTFLCLHFVLMKSIWLAFILSRDVFVLTRIKTRVVFPPTPTANSRRRAFAQNVDFFLYRFR